MKRQTIEEATPKSNIARHFERRKIGKLPFHRLRRPLTTLETRPNRPKTLETVPTRIQVGPIEWWVILYDDQEHLPSRARAPGA